MPSLKAVLFDLDDTLIDWSDFSGDYFALELPHFTQLRDYLTQAGHDLPPVNVMLDVFRIRAMYRWEVGRETMVAPQLLPILRNMLTEDFGVDASALDDDTLRTHYNWNKVPGTKIFPEVPSVLTQLIDAGIKIGIVTNAFQPMIMRDVELVEHDLLQYFPTCRFSACDVGYLKPHPAIFETALACVGTKIEETVFVGDSLTADISGANRLGMTTVWRDVGHRNPKLTRAVVEPDVKIHNLNEMLTFFDERFPDWRTSS